MCFIRDTIDAKTTAIECYDIDPKQTYITQRDTIQSPPDYTDAFVVTNPPYLARNQSSDKTLYDQYKQNDLYKCFLSTLIPSNANGGILILPLNFWCSIRKQDRDLRRRFIASFRILQMNVFEEQVFDDTSYTICAFSFTRDPSGAIPITLYPSKQTYTWTLDETNQYTIGGELYQLEQTPKYTITRLTRLNADNSGRTRIVAKCIDDSATNQIRLSLEEDDSKVFVDNTTTLSARSYATLVIQPPISTQTQTEIVEQWNSFLQKKREQYHSLFLTNYRESKGGFARKRISFALVFSIVNHLLSKLYHP